MVRADIDGGNQVIFVDAGITENGKREEGKIGAIDDRGGLRLETASPNLISEADIIVMHTGFHDSYLVKTQAPIVWIVHGRPLACFRPEYQGKMESYSLYHNVAQWKRSKKMVYFWQEFIPHWSNIFPSEKNACLDYPVIDQIRFNPSGQIHTLQNKGKYNLLVCDSNREDIDTYELTVGCIEAVKQIQGLKVHFYGLDMPLKNCWNILLGKLKELGGLGDVSGRVTNMEMIYRACDGLISPNKIIVRTIAEALSCGIPVIAEEGCKVADFQCKMNDAYDVAEAIKMWTHSIDLGKHKNGVLERAENFSMKNYYTKMNEIYKEVVK
jgi:glycosyltransferase involved in cell wall biosynthesis